MEPKREVLIPTIIEEVKEEIFELAIDEKKWKEVLSRYDTAYIPPHSSSLLQNGVRKTVVLITIHGRTEPIQVHTNYVCIKRSVVAAMISAAQYAGLGNEVRLSGSSNGTDVKLKKALWKLRLMPPPEMIFKE